MFNHAPAPQGSLTSAATTPTKFHFSTLSIGFIVAPSLTTWTAHGGSSPSARLCRPASGSSGSASSPTSIAPKERLELVVPVTLLLAFVLPL